MLHDKALICILNGLRNNIVFHKSAIYIVILKASVSSGNFRFAGVSLNFHKIIFVGDFQKCFRHIPAVYIINHIFYIIVAGGVQLHLFVLNIFERYFRMGKSKLFHHSSNIICF